MTFAATRLERKSVMNHLRRFLGLLAGSAFALLAVIAIAPAALATLPPPVPGGPAVVPPPAIHTIVTGGMPGWQITLIATGAALFAAVVAVLLDRVRAARRGITAKAA
jgi:hypothetical protein